MEYKIQLICGLTVMSGTQEEIASQIDDLVSDIGQEKVDRLFKQGVYTINNQ